MNKNVKTKLINNVKYCIMIPETINNLIFTTNGSDWMHTFCGPYFWQIVFKA